MYSENQGRVVIITTKNQFFILNHLSKNWKGKRLSFKTVTCLYFSFHFYGQTFYFYPDSEGSTTLKSITSPKFPDSKVSAYFYNRKKNRFSMPCNLIFAFPELIQTN